jgi:hypothetical protein
MQNFIEQAARQTGARRKLKRYRAPQLSEVELKLAESAILDPERPEDLFEPYARGGLFREGTRLKRVRDRLRRKQS